jgi:hypothetical protein
VPGRPISGSAELSRNAGNFTSRVRNASVFSRPLSEDGVMGSLPGLCRGLEYRASVSSQSGVGDGVRGMQPSVWSASEVC